MRIAFLLHKFPSVSETFILRQITGLIDRGHQVDIYSERQPDRDEVPTIHSEVTAYDLMSRTVYLDREMPPESGYWSLPVWPITEDTWVPGAELPIRNIDRILQSVPTLRQCLDKAPQLAIEVLDPHQYGHQALSLESLYHLSSLLRRPLQYDVLHAHFGPTAVSFRFASAVWNAPLIVTFHGFDFSSIPKSRGVNSYQYLFRDASVILAISNYATDRLKELGCPPDKLRVMHTGVNLSDFAFRPRIKEKAEPYRILSVGRLVEKKGLQFAVQAVAEVRKRQPDLVYDIIGDGPLRPQLAAMIRDLNLENHAILHGAATGDYVRQHMSRAHVFLLPSVTGADGDQEGIPVSLMEAQACGVPVISTLHSGIPELVQDGKSGLLVQERDVPGLANAISQLIDHSHDWPRMGEQGRKIVEEEFDIGKLNHDLESLYEQVSKQYHSARPAVSS